MASTPGKVRVALAGLGTVGQGVVRLLQKEAPRYRERFGIDLQLVVILDRSYQRKDTSWISSEVSFTESLDDFLETPADVIVELIGGTEPADQIIRFALGEGKSVVTANKLLMARCGTDYLKLAAQAHCYLGFEASVAGGIPIVQVVNHSLSSDRVLRIRGILNGTCNFILSEMANGSTDYQEALTDAQSLGYAESDPSLDVSGEDARDKLAILSTLCFHAGIDPDEIPTRGITEITAVDFLYARKLDSTIKLLGVAARDDKSLCLRVGPFLIDNQLPLSKIFGVLNAVEVTGATVGPVLLSGSGAGEGPTAVSVMADILHAAQRKAGAAGAQVGPVGKSGLQAGDFDRIVGGRENERYPFYVRFFVRDRPGIIATLTHTLAERKINIDLVLQESCADRSNLHFVITVEPTFFSSMQEAVDEMKKLDF
ncbi:homoserine dehydrogenase, partial [Acidobacteria bacterium AH-259-D05]|nr:homoserine dehydrogenase [Acidobacteria bacterium AH-259-D05]